jgi:CheY-like chemotaxis protein
VDLADPDDADKTPLVVDLDTADPDLLKQLDPARTLAIATNPATLAAIDDDVTTLTRPFRSTDLGARLAQLLGLETTPGREIDTAMANRHPMCVLVVEDNPINQRVVERMLEHLGYDPDQASDGVEAVDDRDYELVFLDVQMPRKDGFETAWIRDNTAPEHQPRIVALTGHTSDEILDRCREAGMDAHLAKPVEIEEIARDLDQTPEREA